MNRRCSSVPAVVVGLFFAALAAVAVIPAESAGSEPVAPSTQVAASTIVAGDGPEACVTCHQGIEDMHPWYEITCTECHGGDPQATTAATAHVRAARALPADERILPEETNSAYLRFVNPADLRVVGKTCETCHIDECQDLFKSMHGTTAGHLSDGLYENGFSRRREDRWSIFPVRDDNPVNEHALKMLPGFLRTWDRSKRETLAGHAADLGRKNCMQCHLWSVGTAVRGRLGLDGNYRGVGCIACHVSYADDGLSQSADRTIDKFEPGHPIRHEMTTAPPTDTCTRCHFGDASIGLHFRGLAQLFPGMPAGPEVLGTTDSRLNEVYYINDPKVVPPDLHHAKGMHCIDCHTVKDVMGDGDIYGFMEHAVEIECVDCHGDFENVSNGKTSRGNKIDHLHEQNGSFFLISKVDGRKHFVVQAAHVIDPSRPEYNAKAARAMTERHKNLECYTCHAGWSVNFFGFHFDRNESFSDLDLLTGERTSGRCTTQEKVFATLKHFYLGYNDEGMIAPYLVGFSTMGTVHDEEGEKFIDQLLPVTAEGLSGMTMIHHQLHSTQENSRSCVECHRAPATVGLGSDNFRLTRDFAAVVDELGLNFIALERTNLELSESVSRVSLPGAVAVAAECDELQGHFRYVYVALAEAGVAVVDASNPSFPERQELLAGEDPRDVLLRAGRLYVADGRAGIKIFDVSNPRRRKLLGAVATAEARGLELDWPQLYVADGPGGVKIFDVRDPVHPDFVAHLDINGEPKSLDDAFAVKVMMQYSRPADGSGSRTQARRIAVVAGGEDGPSIFDVSELSDARRIFPPRGTRPSSSSRRQQVRDVELLSRYDLGSPGGGIPTEENDYAYFVGHDDVGGQARMSVLKITDPRAPKSMLSRRIDDRSANLELAHFYNPPFLQRFVLTAGEDGAMVWDFSNSEQPEMVGALYTGGSPVVDLVCESFSFDRMVNEAGTQLKDISHPRSRYLDAKEVLRVLSASLDLDEAEQEERKP